MAGTEGDYGGYGSRSNAKALAAGLRFRPIADTVRDTLPWYDGLKEKQQNRTNARVGLTMEREKEVLAAWHAARK